MRATLLLLTPLALAISALGNDNVNSTQQDTTQAAELRAYRLEFHLEPPTKQQRGLVVLTTQGEYAVSRSHGNAEESSSLSIQGTLQPDTAGRLRLSYSAAFESEDKKSAAHSSESGGGNATIELGRATTIGILGEQTLRVTANLHEDESTQPAVLQPASLNLQTEPQEGRPGTGRTPPPPPRDTSMSLREIGCSNIFILNIKGETIIGSAPNKTEQPPKK